MAHCYKGKGAKSPKKAAGKKAAGKKCCASGRCSKCSKKRKK
jgi:hypothetical protein